MYNRNDNATNTKMNQFFPAHNVQIKIRRTHGWLCPYSDYRSNRRFNTQRHIYKVHGGGEPIDSRTGETMAQKKAAALQTHVFPDMQSDCMMPDTNPIDPIHPKEPSETRRLSTLKLMPQ
jgi:hypothetical protein